MANFATVPGTQCKCVRRFGSKSWRAAAGGCGAVVGRGYGVSVMRGEGSLYEVLGVSAEASEEELVRARRRELKRWHPDRNPDRGALATERFLSIEDAFARIADPVERAAYDRRAVPGTSGGWIRGVDVNDPSWRPPAWSWVGADPIWDLRRHHQFFVRTLHELPDREGVMFSTAHRQLALLVTDRRVFYASRGVTRREVALPLTDIDRVVLARRRGCTRITLSAAGERHRLVLEATLAAVAAGLLRRPA